MNDFSFPRACPANPFRPARGHLGPLPAGAQFTAGRSRHAPFRPPNLAGSGARRRSETAFSLVEMLIVSALLSVIILGLMAMFGQTQRAFRVGLAQTDVLDAGRATADMLAREVEQICPSHLPDTVNYYTEIPPSPYVPLYQDLPGGAERRTNVLMELFFLTRENQRWTAIGYRVSNPNAGVGTLHRFERSGQIAANLPRLLADFLATPLTNLSRVADGVVHFRVRAFDTNGVWITDELPHNGNFEKSDVRWSTLVPGEIGLCQLKSNAVPAAVEIELGFLEARTLARANALPATARPEFLQRQAGRVHLFRQLIPIHSVDGRAYQ